MYEEHREGQVKFLRPPLQKVPSTSMPVFYNPKSELNRDITIGGIQVFLKRHEITKARVCTPLAGTGVRATRIAKEVQGVQYIVAGDINPLASELVKRNAELNGVASLIEVHRKDANHLLSRHNRASLKFDVIDIDPFGSPRPYLTAAVGALKPLALLCLTATDMPVLVGIRRQTCIKRYGAEPARTEYGHELALRLLMGCAIREAAAQDIGLQPLLTFYIDHYIRILCEAQKGDKPAWNSISQLGYLSHCDNCGHRELTLGLVPEKLICPSCSATEISRAGPLWTGCLAEKVFVNETMQQVTRQSFGSERRLTRLLKRLLEELDGPPTYYDLHKLSDKLNIPVPSFTPVIKELREKGFFCSRTHFSPHSIRTSASATVLCQVLQKISRGDK
ncbi:MAG: tRNA (guanine(10)-N(2))-dimethyltransferase [Promethearchaeota archaeon]